MKGKKETSNIEEQDVKKLNSREEIKKKNVVNEERNERRHQPQMNQEKISELEKCKQDKRNKGKYGGCENSIKSQKNKERHDVREIMRRKKNLVV